nr:DNA translocase FtsK [Mesorhizobium shangrilense]
MPDWPLKTEARVFTQAAVSPLEAERARLKRRILAGSASRDVSAVAGQFDFPTWQNYFFLAPNVRFTRTPDSEIPRPERATDSPAVAEQSSASARPTQEATKDAAPRNVVAPAPAPQAPYVDRTAAVARPTVQTPPAQVRAPSVRAASTPAPDSKGVAATTTATNGARSIATQSAADTKVGAAPPDASGPRWPYLSDHAFFECMTLDASDDPAPVRTDPPAPTAGRMPAVAVRPMRARPAVAEITSMFRVIECRSGAQPSPAPVDEPAPCASPEAAVAPEPEASTASSQGATAAPAENDNAAREPKASRVDITMPPVAARSASPKPAAARIVQFSDGDDYELPSEELLQNPPVGQGFYMSQERLEQNADLLESVLEDFGVRGEIIHVRPGPVVTLYEFEPAPGVKSSRVIGLADDIARSMSAVSARVAVVPGRNVIGIELPNETRETVYFRELIEADGFRNTSCKLALCLGKTIGGEPVIAELAKMPHLLVAGTTGSGKSVAINTMILSLLYRLKPEECRLIMVDPKMLELSIYDGIPHLLTPVVTDSKKAVTALKWAVREMEDRYRKMARLGVRNIDGYNQRAAAARDKGEIVTMSVQTGFEKGTGEPLFEEQEIDLAPMPYIVIIVDEMADLMMVAGKEIEGAIQRLAQMARAAGIHLIMATQRPSVDVITGTIKANFPTRISFQVTSKIDSRTILGEQGAEQLLGQGDMLQMAGGGRIVRVHGPFVSDEEVEQVVTHLKTQGRPEYLETVTADEEEEEAEADHGPVFDKGAVASEDGDTTYDEAVKVVLRDKKCSTSYIQRRLGIGYNRAASLVERMEKEGLVGPPNHVGKREIIMGKAE